MQKNQPSGNRKAPNLGAVTPAVVELFERALTERKDLRKWIEHLSSISKPTIRDRLCFALYRHQLSFREPHLPAGVSLTGVSLWQYWASHPEEYRKYESLEHQILSYLKPQNELDLESQRRARKMLDLIQGDQLTFVALYPVVEQLYKKKPGRPVTRRHAAVRALQMTIEKNWTLNKATHQFCDCGKSKHDVSCKQQMRQSIIGLRKLLRKSGVGLPQA